MKAGNLTTEAQSHRGKRGTGNDAKAQRRKGAGTLSLHVTYELTSRHPFLTLHTEGITYKLSKTQARSLLKKLDGFGDECGTGAKRIREQIRTALQR